MTFWGGDGGKVCQSSFCLPSNLFFPLFLLCTMTGNLSSWRQCFLGSRSSGFWLGSITGKLWCETGGQLDEATLFFSPFSLCLGRISSMTTAHSPDKPTFHLSHSETQPLGCLISRCPILVASSCCYPELAQLNCWFSYLLYRQCNQLH